MIKSILYISGLMLVVACGGNAPQPAVEQPKTQPEIPADIEALLQKNTCLTCHALNEKIVGPAYKEVAKRNYPADEIVSLIYKPKPEHWPDYPPMIGLPNVPKEEAKKIADWIVSLQ